MTVRRPLPFKAFSTAVVLSVRRLLSCKIAGIHQRWWSEGIATYFLLQKSGLCFTARAKQSVKLAFVTLKSAGTDLKLSAGKMRLIIPDDEVCAAQALAVRVLVGLNVDPGP